MLTESLLVAGIGAALGIGLAALAVELAVRDHPQPRQPRRLRWITFDIDAPVLAFTVAATLVAAVVSGLLPAWMSSRANVVDALKEGGRGNTSQRIGLVTRGLVVFQVGVTCILLIGSLLQVRSILNQQTIDYGYDTAGIMSARMGLMDGDYPTPAARQRLLRPPPARAQRPARVRRGGAHQPLPHGVLGQRPDRDRRQGLPGEEGPAERELRAGHRDLLRRSPARGSSTGGPSTDDDLDTKLPVAIVNAAFARKHFGTESPVGRRFRAVDGNTRQPGPWRTIVGVASTIRMLGPFNNPNVDDTGFYVPFYANPTGPVLARAVRQPVRHRGREAARRPARRVPESPAAPAR